MKKLILGLIALCATLSVSAQKYYTKDAKVSFDATSALEKIVGANPKGTLVIDGATGKIEAAVLIKGIHFDQALMEEHFNENYMESTKFPKATFTGDIPNYKTVNLEKDGNYNVTLKGKLTIHGVTKDVETKAILSVKNKMVTFGKANFTIAVADYGIKIPGIVKDKIAKEAKIEVSGYFTLLK